MGALMRDSRAIRAVLAAVCILAPAAAGADHPIQVRTGTEGQLLMDGKAVFPIGFTTGPPTGAKAPNGNNAFAELAKNGFVFFQWLSRQLPWDPKLQAEVDALMQEASQNGVKI